MQDGSVQERRGGPHRRLACDPCRDRKIRCDRQQPVCGRCARLGHDCNYSSPSKKTAAKQELSELLLQMHSRLAQAEAQLAQHPPDAQTAPQPWQSSTLDMDFDWLGLDTIAATAPVADTTVATTASADVAPTQPRSLPTSTEPVLSHDDPFAQRSVPPEVLGDPPSNADPSDMAMADAFLVDAHIDWFNMNTTSHDLAEGGTTAVRPGNLSPTRSTQTNTASGGHTAETSNVPSGAVSVSSRPPDTFSPTILDHLHNRFFGTIDAILGGMINWGRLQAEVAGPSPAINSQALSYAVAALGALTSDEYVPARDKCYNRARELLDQCERQDSGAMLVSINTLQTCVLLALYEFKSPNFARLWMTLGRTIRLARLMGLDMLDADPSTTSAGMLKLPPATTPSEQEERRRTFWILYIFDVSAAMRSHTVTPAFDACQVSVRLPGTGDVAQIDRDSVMPLLRHIEGLAPDVILPPLAGTVFIGYLYQRLLDHVHLSHQQQQQQQNPEHAPPSYPFWETHYALDRLLRDCRARTSREPPSPKDRVLHLTMQCNMAAVEMLLHDTALFKAETEAHLPAVLGADAENRCAAAALRVHDVIVQGRRLARPESDGHRQSGEFIIWPIISAITILRMQQRSPRASELEPPNSYPGTIRVLCEGLKDLVPLELVPDGVLDEPARAESREGSEDALEGRERAPEIRVQRSSTY